jgi:integrase/recombinase XerD
MLQDSIEQYLALLAESGEQGGGKNSNTIMAYRNDLYQLCQFVQERGVEQWPQVTRELLALYFSGMHQQYRPATIVRKLAACRSFFRYICEVGGIEVSPAEGLEVPPVQKEPPHILSGEQVKKLFAQISSATPVGLRNMAMLHLLYATGMRVSELVALDLDDVSVWYSTVRCGGHNGHREHERLLPLPAHVVEKTQLYILEGRPRLLRRDDEPALFVNHHGERLTRQGFWLIIKNYARQAGIEEITPHMLRHSFAAFMLRNGMELHMVQELLGHVHSSTMHIYDQILQMENINE